MPEGLSDRQVSKESYEASTLVYATDPCEYMLMYRPDSYWCYRQEQEHQRRMDTDPQYAKRIRDQEAKTKAWRKWLDDNNVGVLRGGPNESKVKVTEEEMRLKHREIFGKLPMNSPS